MSSVESWRRAALAAYVLAGAALASGGYALATTQANVNAIAAAQKRLDDDEWSKHQVSFSEGDCTECQESAARPVGAIFCGSVPCAEQRQAMPLNRRCRMRRPCASLGHTTP